MRAIGFIGLGNMGLPMAVNLADGGHAVRAHDRAHTARDRARAAGLDVAADVRRTVERADVVVTMLPDGPSVLEVLDTVRSEVPPGATLIDCSTIDIDSAREAHRLAANTGLGFLDAPVSGGTGGAASGTLTVMVGGEANVLGALDDVLAPLAGHVLHCGGAGAGQAAKLCNNMLLATSMAGTCEAFALGRRLGLDPAKLFEVLSSSSGSCWSVTAYCPVAGVGPLSPADRDFEPGFTAHMMLKDAELARRAAESIDLPTPLGERALELYAAFVDAGGGERDFSALIEYLECDEADRSGTTRARR